MSLYPCRQALRPVDASMDPRIIPTQMIGHVSVSWVAGSGPGFHDGLDWHFYVASGPGTPEELVTQLRDTHWQADANFHANGPRGDGSGAVSFESEGTGDEGWDDDQLQAIIWLYRKGNEIDNIPLIVCTGPNNPGIGYHRLFNEWNYPYHACPGDAKVQQFYDIIVPALLNPAPIIPEEVMTSPPVFDQFDRQWVFVRGNDDQLWAKVDNSAWFALGGVLTSGPNASFRPASGDRPATINITVRGLTMGVYELVIYPGGEHYPVGWTPLGGLSK